jgi:class 3 adenylate cyclase
VTIVASDAVVARAGAGFPFEQLGELLMRGRNEPVRAFQLGERRTVA